MTHSYAERPTLTCPQCGASFTPELWLIIDAAERPDLLARVREGSIHAVACSNGHAAEVDTPLLLYRAGEGRPLLFSPAQRTTAEKTGRATAGCWAGCPSCQNPLIFGNKSSAV